MNQAKQLAKVGLLSALLCIAGPLTLVLPFSPVPLSLCTLAIYFIAYTFGMRLGLLSTIVYLFIGFSGLPVFSGFSGGVGRLLGPSGGYLIGYLLLAWISGLFADHFPANKGLCLLGMVLGTIACYLLGTTWLAIQSSLGFLSAVSIGVLPFFPLDCIKMVLAFFAGTDVRKRLKKANLL